MFAALSLTAALLASPMVQIQTVPGVEALFAPVADPAGPGCAVSVARNGTVVFERTYGLANLEQIQPITADTVFEAGSVSKQFTAALIAALVAQGRLSLDDDIRTYLPEMPDYGLPITVRMLLTQVSGVRNWDDLAELEGYGRGNRVHRQSDALAMIVRQTATNFEPGSEYLYSNSNYVLAMVIAERVGGKPFDELSRELLFDPVGMEHSRWRVDHTSVVPNRADAYTPDEVGVLHLDMPFEDVVGPGGLLTTVGDLQRWNAFLDHPSPEAVAWVTLLTRTREDLTDGTRIAYGMGLEYDEIWSHPVVSHAGATGGYRAYLARVPDAALSVALLCNAGALNTEDLGPQLVQAFLPAPTVVSADRGIVPIDAGSSDLAGYYRNERTQQRAEVAVDAEGVHFNGGPAFTEVSDGRFENVGRTRSATIMRNASGGIDGIVLTRVGNIAVTLRPVSSWTPDRTTLQHFEGRYDSAEARTTWTIRFDGDTLRAAGPTGETFLLDPIYADAFSARDAYWTFIFDRGADGRPAGYRAFKTRTRGVIFRRTGD